MFFKRSLQMYILFLTISKLFSTQIVHNTLLTGRSFRMIKNLH